MVFWARKEDVEDIHLHGNMNQLHKVPNETHHDETNSDSPAELDVFCKRVSLRSVTEAQSVQGQPGGMCSCTWDRENRLAFLVWLGTPVDKLHNQHSPSIIRL